MVTMQINVFRDFQVHFPGFMPSMGADFKQKLCYRPLCGESVSLALASVQILIKGNLLYNTQNKYKLESIGSYSAGYQWGISENLRFFCIQSRIQIFLKM